MFTELNIENFKGFKVLDFKPTMLNVLTGLNGSGKSSLIQAILFLKTISERSLLPRWRINLNKDLLEFGTYADLHYAYSQEENDLIRIGFGVAGSSCKYQFEILDAASTDEEVEIDLAKPLREEFENSELTDYLSRYHWNHMMRCLQIPQYISAYRLPPQQEHSYSIARVKNHHWGSMGEYAVAYLAEWGMKQMVMPGICHESERNQNLQAQVDAWMNVVSPGACVIAENLDKINKTVLSVAFAKGVNHHPFRPQNVGFGISYVLPLLVMILRSQPGDCLIVENPEAHLHPRGQAELGRLLALAANHGVQIFVETHSDHVLNGVRVAVKHERIQSGDVVVAFFNRNAVDTGELYEQVSKIDVIKLVDGGEFDHFPEGFMDEWNKQLLDLMAP